MPAYRPLKDRFWDKVDRRGTDECWTWTAATVRPTGGRHVKPQVYGKLAASRRESGPTRTFWLAHRLSWTLHHGDIPEGLVVDHMCHNTLCVNPHHLRLTTPKQNSENRAGLDASNRSGFRGVSWNATERKWRATVKHRGQSVYLGSFATRASAAEAAQHGRVALFTHNDLDRAA